MCKLGMDILFFKLPVYGHSPFCQFLIFSRADSASLQCNRRKCIKVGQAYWVNTGMLKIINSP